MQNGNIESEINENIFDYNNLGNQKNILKYILGGGAYLNGCYDMEINNLKVENFVAEQGGGFYLQGCKGKIENCIFENNEANLYGGGIFLNGQQNTDIELINTKIIGNSTKNNSGGGIYSNCNLLIDGEDTLISDNTAGGAGGGIVIGFKAIMKNGTICNNKAMKGSGGGIILVSKGVFNLVKGEIRDNWSYLSGGGINYDQGKEFLYDESKLEQMIFNNYSKDIKSNIFP